MQYQTHGLGATEICDQRKCVWCETFCTEIKWKKEWIVWEKTIITCAWHMYNYIVFSDINMLISINNIFRERES